MKKLVVWGASGHAMVVADIVRLRGEYDIVGFLDDVTEGRNGEEFFGLPVFSGRDSLAMLCGQGVRHAIVAFGNCPARLKVAEYLRAQGLELVTAVHPSAVVARDVVIGEGTVVAAGAVINPGVHVGANVIINTSASVDHECTIEDGAHICPGVRLAGRVAVGEGAWIGIGSSIIDRVRIGAGSFIGAGSVVVGDIPDNALAYGVPAKIRKRIE
ncbi:acetyltransferase [Geobacter metallireducens]|uniref:acetyltransferase n=1 Tax=Geobacter metallireducens TaxID=28232 RepID=UPI001EE44A66|nr:acetyltransferase [Geobacter metallireducens]